MSSQFLYLHTANVDDCLHVPWFPTSCKGNWEYFKSFYRGNLTCIHLGSILLLGLIFYSFLLPMSYTSQLLQWRWCLNALDGPAHFHLVRKSVISKNSNLFVCITPTAICLKYVPLFLSMKATNPFWRCLCVLHLFQNIFRTVVRSKWDKIMSSNSFGKKGIKFIFSSTKNASWQNNFFLGKIISWNRDKLFCDFLTLIWI